MYMTKYTYKDGDMSRTHTHIHTHEAMAATVGDIDYSVFLVYCYVSGDLWGAPLSGGVRPHS